jgi:hypothetical protein
MSNVRQSIGVVAAGMAFLTAVLLGASVALWSIPYIAGSSLVLLCSIAATVRDFRISSTVDLEPWLKRLVTIHATASLVLALFAGYSLTKNGYYESGLFSLLFSIIAAILTIGLQGRKPWIPLSIPMVYFCLMAIPIGVCCYLRLASPFYSFFTVGFYLLFVCAPSFFAGYANIRVVFSSGRSRAFSPHGIFRFDLGSLFVWFTLAILLLISGSKYARWLVDGGPMKSIMEVVNFVI